MTQDTAQTSGQAPGARIPTTLLAGALGVGKTTALLHLLSQRPAHERWAVLVNEFGQVGVDGSALADASGVTIKELAGGCICCTSGLSFQITLTLLLQRERFDRLIIEPTGLAKPGALIDIMREPGLRERLEPRATLTLVDPRALLIPEHHERELYQDQIEAADVLIANRCDLASPEALLAFDQVAASLYPPKLQVLKTQRGQLPLSLLELSPQRGLARQEDAADERLEDVSRLPRLVRFGGQVATPERAPAPQGQALIGQGLGYTSCGWIYGPQQRFDARLLGQWMRQVVRGQAPGLPVGAVRVKGVVNTAHGWIYLDADMIEVQQRACQHRRDSRIEIIARESPPPRWDEVEQALLACALETPS